MYNTPLTQEQSDFAAEHHKLIFSFLNTYKYPENDYYDVAALGYISAIKTYFNREDLRNRFAFSTIAYSRMSGYTWRYKRSELRHSAKTISYDDYKRLAPRDNDSPEIINLAKEFFSDIPELLAA